MGFRYKRVISRSKRKCKGCKGCKYLIKVIEFLKQTNVGDVLVEV